MHDPLGDLYFAARGLKQTVRTSYDIARMAIESGVPGDFVECGVFAGAQAAAMARGWIDAGHALMPYRKVHLFDSFAGVPAPGPRDIGWTHPEGVSACSREECERFMWSWNIPPELLVWHVGDFADTVPAFAFHGPQIAVLRLDGDLYESTKVCIEQLEPLVSPGGWIIVDDWQLQGCREAVTEYLGREYKQEHPAPIYFQKAGA